MDVRFTKVPTKRSFAGAIFLQLIALLCTGGVSNAELVEQELIISTGQVSPDGGPERLAILTNGKFGGPVIRVKLGDVLKMDIQNQIQEGYEGFNSTSIHYHGFRMQGIPYFDGVGFVSQCPIYPGNDMTAEFTVQEIPGTYMWHAHTSTLIADGLSGGLIVLPEINEGDPEDDHVIVLTEFFNETAPVLSTGLNGVGAPAMANQGYANFSWVGSPRSLLMNFKGCYADCKAAGDKGIIQVCNPDPECASRYVLNVEPKTTVRIRLIGAGSLLYQTVCFEGHNLTLIEEDARAVEPLALGECVDVNLGQRMDVLLETKDQRELNQTSFWITGRGGKDSYPASYGVLQYRTAAGGGAGVSLPPSPPPQPIDAPKKWSNTGFSNNIVSPKSRPLPKYITDGKSPNKRAVVEISEPVLQQTGQSRIAMGNVVYLATPSCNNALELTKSGEWLSPESNRYLIDSAEDVERINITDIPGLGEASGSGDSYVLLNLAFNTSLMPKQPVAGQQVLELNSNDVIDVLIQNNKDGAFGGLDPGSSGIEFEHSIHLHGHHFFVLGEGKGNFLALEQESSLDTLLNFENPREVDTATLPSYGWLYVRFQATNPGVWPMHCHIAWHEWMGQFLIFAEDVPKIPSIPPGILPQCPATCDYNAAPALSTTMSTDQANSDSSSDASFGLDVGRLLLSLFWIFSLWI